MMFPTRSEWGTNLAARQTSADCIISIAEEIGYPDTLIYAHFLVGSLAQLVHLQARRMLACETHLHNSPFLVMMLCWAPVVPQSSIVQGIWMWCCECCLPCQS